MEQGATLSQRLLDLQQGKANVLAQGQKRLFGRLRHPPGQSCSRILFVLAISFLLIGCQSAKTEQVLLRYTPEVGKMYRYTLIIPQPHGPIEVTGDMHVLSEQEDGYRVQFSGMLADEVLSRAMTISDRHNASDPGYISLNFPDEPVLPDTEWSGFVPWYFENYYVLDPAEIYLPALYRFLQIEKGESARVAVIEQSTDVDVAVDGLVLHVGQVGIQWDQAGTITGVSPGYDASGKLQVDDVIVGINGQEVGAAGSLAWLAERYIQRPKEANVVSFTVLRDGQEQQIDVVKSIDKLAVVRVSNVKGTLQTTFDIDRGILLSVEATITQEDVGFTSPTTEPFPIVDDYGGFHKFGYLKGKTTYEDHLGSEYIAWTLSLVE
jgi:hypothetical protein